jgi:hypothetical protein
VLDLRMQTRLKLSGRHLSWCCRQDLQWK